MKNNREQWGSRLGFILAASGSAVGLGNIWKYTHMAGQNGGAAFTIVYLICILRFRKVFFNHWRQLFIHINSSDLSIFS